MRTLAAFAAGSALLASWLPLAVIAQVSPPPLPAPTTAPPPLPRPPSGSQYFYDDNGKPAGPYSAEEIRQRITAGSIMPATLLWKAGTPSWVAAKDLPEFAGAAARGGAVADVALDNLSFKLGEATVTVPHVAIKASSLSQSEVLALLNESLSAATADKLAKFDASSIVIPEIRLDVAMPGTDVNGVPASASAVYRDLRLDDVKGGKAARMSMSGATGRIPGPIAVNATMGAFLATDCDFGAALRFVYAAAAPGETPRQISGPATIADIRVTASSELDLSIGRMARGAVSARPLSTTPLASLARWVPMAAATRGPLDPAEVARMIDAAVDFFDAVAVDGWSISDVSFKIPDHKFRPLLLKTLELGRIANARFAEIGIEGLDVDASDQHFKLARMALFGLDLKPFLSTMAPMVKKGDLGPLTMWRLDWHAAVPRLDGFIVKGVDVLLPDPEPKPLTLAGFELKLGNYVGGIPTVLRAQLDNLVVDAGLLRDIGGLTTFGYRNLGLSSIVDLAWNETSQAIAINEISAKGADMGSVTLKAAFGDVPRELFAGTLPQMQIAALGVTLGEFSIGVEDAGLADRIVQQIAKDEGETPDALRLQWGMQAQLGIPRILGGSDQAKALARAVASFIVKPMTFKITVKAKGLGLGVSDVVSGGMPNPAAIFGKLDVTASANE